jgi:hypothetical protein
MSRPSLTIALTLSFCFSALAACSPDASDIIGDEATTGIPSGPGSTGGTGSGGTGGGLPAGSLEWTATAPTAGADCVAAHTYALPSWLQFKSPSAGKTTQTSASSLCAGFGPDAPRARNVTPDVAESAWGLSIESARTNKVTDSDSWKGANWVPFNMTQTASAETDPTGGTAASLFSSKGNQASTYHAKINGRVASAWLRGGAVGSAPYAHFRHFGGAGAPYADVTSTSWARYSIMHPMNTDGEVALETRGVPMPAKAIPMATDILAFGAQVEPDGAYPSSYIPTKASALTREAESLSSDALADLAPGGFFDVIIRFAPNFAHDEQGADEYNILFFDDQNRLFLRKSDHTLVLRAAGADVVSDALTWGREQELTVAAKNVEGESVSLSVTGATSGDGAKMGGAAVSIPAPASGGVRILGGEKGAEECADLRSISFARK